MNDNPLHNQNREHGFLDVILSQAAWTPSGHISVLTWTRYWCRWHARCVRACLRPTDERDVWIGRCVYGLDDAHWRSIFISWWQHGIMISLRTSRTVRIPERAKLPSNKIFIKLTYLCIDYCVHRLWTCLGWWVPWPTKSNLGWDTPCFDSD